MIRRLSLFGVFALALLTGACSWLGFDDRDPTDPSKLIAFEPRLEVTELWSRDVGAGGDELGARLVPAVYGGRVFVANREGKVMALNAETGERVWKIDTKVRFGAGPSVAAGLVVLGGIDGTVLALDSQTGEVKWRSQVSSEVLALPAIAGSRVIVRSIDGRIHALNRLTGERMWVFDSDVPLLTLRGISNPIVHSGMVIVGLDGGSVVALSLNDGSTVWKTEIAEPEGRTELARLVDIDGHLALRGRRLYVASYQGYLAFLDARTGRIMWRRPISTSTGVTLDGRRLFVTDENDSVWAFSVNGGGSLWKNDKLLYRKLTAPVPYKDYVVVGDFAGYLHVLSQKTGAMLARVRVGETAIDVRPRVRNGVLYVLTRGGDLAAYRMTPR